MAAKAKRIELSDEDRAELERTVRSTSAERRMVERARIVLCAAEGCSAKRIAAEVGMSSSHAHEILGAADVKPHRTDYWIMSELGPVIAGT